MKLPLKRAALFGLITVISSTPVLGGESPRARFAHELVLPTYTELAEKSIALESAVLAVADDPGTDTISRAREAWVEARAPWETSEAFLFGPVDTEGHDPLLDSWPVNLTDLRGILRTKAALTPERLGALGEGFTGFHVIEYFLFADAGGAPLTAEASAQYLAAEPIARQYLAAAATQLRTQTEHLLADYATTGGGFVSEIANAGSGSSLYPEVEAIAEEIALAMIGIVEEVRLAKLLEPVETNDSALLESRFSGQTLVDIENNLAGVAEAFQIAIAGSLPSESREGIESALNDFRSALGAIDPVALHRNPEAAGTEVRAAAALGAILQQQLEDEVLGNLEKIAETL